MKVLVANLGSTSFKYRLFDLSGTGEAMLTKGGYERVEDFSTVITDCLEKLVADGYLGSLNELDAVGFKTVHGGPHLSGCVLADEKCLEALDSFALVAPAHNPAYANGIRQFAVAAPRAQRVALFETAFYQWAPEPSRHYALPKRWREAGIRRYGFHGASHKFLAERAAECCGREDIAARVRQLYVHGPGESPQGQPFRHISCHLGGSSSLAGIDSGVAIGASMGFSPQGGLPQNNRVGDLDSMALPFAMRTFGLSLDEAETQLARESGLLGLSGVSNDLRDILAAADNGNAEARLAIDVFVSSLRHWLGAFLVELGGLECLTFTGGIGEHNPQVRADVCRNLEAFGIRLDPARNDALIGGEGCISADNSTAQVWVIPTNEELVVARETKRLLEHLQP